MQWEKKICIRITVRRIIIAILIATSSVNLIIVGAAFKAAPTATSTIPNSIAHTQILTATFVVPTATTESAIVPIASQAETLTLTSSPTYTFTSTDTLTPSRTPTIPPSPTQCVPKSYWYIYYVQSGDTLYALARSIDSTVDEIRLANCLTGVLIIKGQLLYLPRLPIKTPTPTATYTPRPDLPPVVTIISAKVKSINAYDGYDQNSGLWFTYVVLEGNAVDSQDGILSGSSLTWTTDRTDIFNSPFLGSGSSITAILYSNNCPGVWHTITLTATDSNGNIAIASVKIFIGADCQIGLDDRNARNL